LNQNNVQINIYLTFDYCTHRLYRSRFVLCSNYNQNYEKEGPNYFNSRRNIQLNLLIIFSKNVFLSSIQRCQVIECQEISSISNY
jgi:hypothetical protein